MDQKVSLGSLGKATAKADGGREFKWRFGEYAVRIIGASTEPGKEGKADYLNLRFEDKDGHQTSQNFFHTQNPDNPDYINDILPNVLKSHTGLDILEESLQYMVTNDVILTICIKAGYTDSRMVSIYRKERPQK